MSTRATTAVAFAMFYGIYGAAIGAVVLLCVVMPLAQGLGEHTGVVGFLLGIGRALAMTFLMLPVAFALGLLPGIATGTAFWWLRTRTAVSRLPVLAKGAVGAAVAWIACAVFCVCFGASVADLGSPELWSMYLVPGLVAGFLCTWLVERQARKASLS